MEISPPAMTKYLVTGEMADQTHSQQGHEVLSKQALSQAYGICSHHPQILAGLIREAGWIAFVTICNHKACICFYYAGYQPGPEVCCLHRQHPFIQTQMRSILIRLTGQQDFGKPQSPRDYIILKTAELNTTKSKIGGLFGCHTDVCLWRKTKSPPRGLPCACSEFSWWFTSQLSTSLQLSCLVNCRTCNLVSLAVPGLGTHPELHMDTEI